MPLAQFAIPAEDVRITEKFHTPQRVSEIKYWIKAARKLIPEIPESEPSHYDVNQKTIFLTWDQFECTPRKHLVIDRTVKVL